MIASKRVMLLYWGRRGAMTRFALEAGRAALEAPGLETSISVSRQNEAFDDYTGFGPALFPVDTFASDAGALLQSWRIPILRRRLRERVLLDRTEAIVELMPHVWSAAILPSVRKLGVRYATIVHDAEAHPGDRTAHVKRVLDRAAQLADVVLTLSETVAGKLLTARTYGNKPVKALFHPDLSFVAPPKRRAPFEAKPIRLLFLGRIMAYKGLSLFIDTVERLRQGGVAVELGIFGEGDLGSEAQRLNRMGAEVVNRWMSDAEIANALTSYHAVVLSHLEASQSGVAAAALGAGIPVIATPVGGLVEQVRDKETGILATRVDPESLAHAVKRLFNEPTLYMEIVGKIEQERHQRSMPRFVEEALRAVFL